MKSEVSWAGMLWPTVTCIETLKNNDVQYLLSGHRAQESNKYTIHEYLQVTWQDKMACYK